MKPAMKAPPEKWVEFVPEPSPGSSSVLPTAVLVGAVVLAVVEEDVGLATVVGVIDDVAIVADPVLATAPPLMRLHCPS